jgi:hypothetical protein
MTTTEQRPVRPIRKEGWIISGGERPLWVEAVGWVLLAAILVSLIVVGFAITNLKSSVNGFLKQQANPTTGQPTLGAPTKQTWSANTSNYCIFVGDMNNLALGPLTTFGATLLANAAPTQAAHVATLHLYSVVAHHGNTTAAISTVNNSYSCPTK